MRRSLVPSALLVGAALLVASCSFSTGSKHEYDAGAVEDALRGLQEGKVGGLELGEASCPDDVELEEGVEFTCTLAVGDVEAPYAVTLTKVDADEPKIHVEPTKAIIKVDSAVSFVEDNLNEEAVGAEVDCGDAQALLVDPGKTVDCTVTLGGEETAVQLLVKDVEGNVTFGEQPIRHDDVRARAHAGLTATEVLALARNAFEVAWLTPRVRDGFLAELDAHAAAFGVTG